MELSDKYIIYYDYNKLYYIYNNGKCEMTKFNNILWLTIGEKYKDYIIYKNMSNDKLYRLNIETKELTCLNIKTSKIDILYCNNNLLLYNPFIVEIDIYCLMPSLLHICLFVINKEQIPEIHKEYIASCKKERFI